MLVCFMMTESTKTNTGESSRTTTQMRISEIVFDRITDRKLDENNYLQQKQVIEIYVAGQGKTSHLLADSPVPITNGWTLDDNILLHQILAMMELKIQDLVLHCINVKKLWGFLRIFMEEAATSTEFMILYKSCFERNRMADPWTIATASLIAWQRSFDRYF